MASQFEQQLTEPWGLDPTMVVTPGTSSHQFAVSASHVRNPVSATPYQIHLLLEFNKPSRISEILERFPFERGETEAFLKTCCETGILRPKEPGGGLASPETVPVDRTVFDAPPFDPSNPPAFCFLGLPFDGNTTGQPGARFGPGAVRAASGVARYCLDPVTQVPLGFHDYALGETLAAGLTIADTGDVYVSPGEDCVALYSRITDVVRDLLQTGTLPLMIGGDHSLTAPILDAFGQDPFQILHLDAHTDLGLIERPDETGLHHGNVFSMVLEQQPNLHKLVQVGLRGLADGSQGQPQDKVVSYGIDRLREGGLTRFLDELRTDLPTYISIDIDVVDPAFAPATGTPLPGGLFPHEFKTILRTAGQRLEVFAADLMEVSANNPTDGTGTIALEGLLSLMSGICDRVLLSPSHCQDEGDDGERSTTARNRDSTVGHAGRNSNAGAKG